MRVPASTGAKQRKAGNDALAADELDRGAGGLVGRTLAGRGGELDRGGQPGRGGVGREFRAADGRENVGAVVVHGFSLVHGTGMGPVAACRLQSSRFPMSGRGRWTTFGGQ